MSASPQVSCHRSDQQTFAEALGGDQQAFAEALGGDQLSSG